MAPTVRNNPDRSRYEIVTDDDDVAGFAEYQMTDGRIVFTHTEVDDRHEGQGLGSTLVKSALDATRARGRKLVAQCPFFAAYIERHPEYADLVDEELAARLAR